jgi:2-dehydro-3-deoxyphosphogalactonate aldolase
MLSIPGFFTATEAFAALKSGADYLKLFPAVLGPGYIKDLQAVIKVPILAFGGVDQDNIAGFVRVCAGVGIGNALYKPGKNPAEIAADAAMLVQNIRRAVR